MLRKRMAWIDGVDGLRTACKCQKRSPDEVKRYDVAIGHFVENVISQIPSTTSAHSANPELQRRITVIADILFDGVDNLSVPQLGAFGLKLTDMQFDKDKGMYWFDLDADYTELVGEDKAKAMTAFQDAVNKSFGIDPTHGPFKAEDVQNGCIWIGFTCPYFTITFFQWCSAAAGSACTGLCSVL